MVEAEAFLDPALDDPNPKDSASFPHYRDFRISPRNLLLDPNPKRF